MRWCGTILYSGAGHGWQYGACALHAGYLRLQTTLRIRNTYCFSTAKMAARTRHHVTLYVHCVSCLFYLLLSRNYSTAETRGYNTNGYFIFTHKCVSKCFLIHECINNSRMWYLWTIRVAWQQIKQDLHMNLNPGFPWQKQHPTRKKIWLKLEEETS